MGGCIDGYVDTYRHMGIMHVHMCIHMVGLHIRTGWPAHASAGHTHIHNKMVRWVSGDGGTLLRRGEEQDKSDSRGGLGMDSPGS